MARAHSAPPLVSGCTCPARAWNSIQSPQVYPRMSGLDPLQATHSLGAASGPQIRSCCIAGAEAACPSGQAWGRALSTASLPSWHLRAQERRAAAGSRATDSHKLLPCPSCVSHCWRGLGGR